MRRNNFVIGGKALGPQAADDGPRQVIDHELGQIEQDGRKAKTRVEQADAGEIDGRSEVGYPLFLRRIVHPYVDRSYIHVHPSGHDEQLDRKSTRLNSSHANISYAVFCLKKKNFGSPSRPCPTLT